MAGGGVSGVPTDGGASAIDAGAASSSFNDALSQLQAMNQEVTILNAKMQIEQARHTALNKAIDSMNESVVKAGSTKRA